MTFEDKMLICRDCKSEFLFSAAEQEFFSKKGLSNVPKRCPNCRLLYRVHKSGEDVKGTTEVACASCGKPTLVPFKPRGHRPIYCLSCLQNNKIDTPDEAPVVEDVNNNEASQ